MNQFNNKFLLQTKKNQIIIIETWAKYLTNWFIMKKEIKLNNCKVQLAFILNYLFEFNQTKIILLINSVSSLDLFAN